MQKTGIWVFCFRGVKTTLVCIYDMPRCIGWTFQVGIYSVEEEKIIREEEIQKKKKNSKKNKKIVHYLPQFTNLIALNRQQPNHDKLAY